MPSLQASDAAGKVKSIWVTFSEVRLHLQSVSGIWCCRRLCLSATGKNAPAFRVRFRESTRRCWSNFWTAVRFERHLNRMRKSYSRKHEALLDGLKPFLGNLTFRGKMRDCIFCSRIASDAAKKELVDAARRQGVKVYGLSSALVGAGCPGGCVSRNRFDRLWRPDGGRNPGWSGAACSGVADRKKIVIFRDKYRIIGVGRTRWKTDYK